MKKLYLLAGIATILVVVIACEKSSIDVDEMQTIKEELSAKTKLDKVTICHYDWEVDEYYQISVNGNSVEKHMANHQYTDRLFDPTDAEDADSVPDLTTDGEAPAVFVNDYDDDGIADCADCSNTGIEDSEKTFKYYRDADLDGFGDEFTFILKCSIGLDADEKDVEFYWKDGFKYILDGNDECDDHFNYSPEGTYQIFKENATGCLVHAELTVVNIELIDTEYIITGNGSNKKGEAQNFYGKAFVDDNNHTVKLYIWKKKGLPFTPDEKTEIEDHFIDESIYNAEWTFDLGGYGTIRRHDIGGVLTECGDGVTGGIIEDLIDLHGSKDYSFDPFDPNPNLVDDDGDGFTECDGDCDDDDDKAFPFSPYGKYDATRLDTYDWEITIDGFELGKYTGFAEYKDGPQTADIEITVLPDHTFIGTFYHSNGSVKPFDGIVGDCGYGITSLSGVWVLN